MSVFGMSRFRRQPRHGASGIRVLVVGPDGSGKTTVARELGTAAAAAGWNVRPTHFRPLPSSAASRAVTKPHAKRPHLAPVAILRLLVRFGEFCRGFVTVWRKTPVTVVVVERGWWDQVVDPKRYRLPSRLDWLVKWLGALLPTFDVTVFCDGSPYEMAARKPELTADETARQLRVWRWLAPLTATTVLTLDTTASAVPEDLWHRVVERRAAHTLWREVPGTPSRLAMRVKGRGRGAVASLKLYQPLSWRGRAGKSVACIATFLGLGRKQDFPEGELLLRSGVVDPCSPMVVLSSNGQRAYVARSKDRVFKVGGLEDEELAAEIAILDHLPPTLGPAITPEVLAVHEVGGTMRAIEMRAFQGVSRQGSAMNEIALQVACALARTDITHGDFVPWNLLVSGPRSCLIDWQRATLGLRPGWDIFTWHVQSATHLGPAVTPERFVGLALAPDGWLWRYATETGLRPGDVAHSLIDNARRWKSVPTASQGFAKETAERIGHSIGPQ